MKLSIAERLHPFSHRNGAAFLLPKTLWRASSYPTRLILSPIEGNSPPILIDFDWVGPVRQFTTELDLEHSSLRVWGETKEGTMRYTVVAKEDGIWVHFEKIPKAKTLVRCSLFSFPFSLTQKEYLFLPLQGLIAGRASQERLSLGKHRQQDWERMKERLDLKEIVPLWLRLGQQYGNSCAEFSVAPGGVFSILAQCDQLKKMGDKKGLSLALEELFLVAFEGCLIPRLEDLEFQGILPKCCETIASLRTPLLLEMSAQLIRSLFFQEVKDNIYLLPCLLPEFHCGRYLHLKTRSQLVIDFEWTKKCLRRIVITGSVAQQVTLFLPKGLASCRLRLGNGEKRRKEITRQGELSFPIASGETLLLDMIEA